MSIEEKRINIKRAKGNVDEAADCLTDAVKRFSNAGDGQGAKKSQDALEKVNEIKEYIKKRGC